MSEDTVVGENQVLSRLEEAHHTQRFSQNRVHSVGANVIMMLICRCRCSTTSNAVEAIGLTLHLDEDIDENHDDVDLANDVSVMSEQHACRW
jgi:hypothetical protein